MPRDISVVVPAYNESDRIGETLHAIKQLNSVDEIVVVDDGSADNTYDIAREWADVLIRREHNHGKGPPSISDGDSLKGTLSCSSMPT